MADLNYLDTEGLRVLIAEQIAAIETRINDRLFTGDVYNTNSTHNNVIPSAFATRNAIIKGIQEHMVDDISDLADDGHVPSALAVTNYVDAKVVNTLEDPKAYQAPSAKAVSDAINALNDGIEAKVTEVIGTSVDEKVSELVGSSVESTVNEKIAALLSDSLDGEDAETTAPSTKVVKEAIEGVKLELTESISSEVTSAVSAIIVEAVGDETDKTPSSKAVNDAISSAIDDKIAELLDIIDADDPEDAITVILDKVSGVVKSEITDVITDTIDGESDNEHVPSAKAVNDAIDELRSEIPVGITEDTIRKIFQEELAKVQSGNPSDSGSVPEIDADEEPDAVI